MAATLSATRRKTNNPIMAEVFSGAGVDGAAALPLIITMGRAGNFMKANNDLLARFTARQKTLAMLVIAGGVLFLATLPHRHAALMMPVPETAFIATISQARESWIGAPNDLARVGMRQARAAALCRVLPTLGAQSWSGWITRIEPNALPDFAGKESARIVIMLTPHLTLSTPESPLLNLPQMLVEADSPIYATARNLALGQRVTFSARFLPSNEDCMAEESFSSAGSMRNPDFKIVLTALAGAS